MELHYYLIAFFILGIILFQLVIYIRTGIKRKQFEEIFPENAEDEWVILKPSGVQIVSKLIVAKQDQVVDYQHERDSIRKELNIIECNIERYERYANDETSDVSQRYTELLKEAKIEQERVRLNLRECEKKIKQAQDEIAELSQEIETLDTSARSEIINSINRYLQKNKNSVADFNLIRDIIDRNCDAIEEEIQTQIPIPLYFGLIGTMLGILVGVGALVSTGSLENLLRAFQPPEGIVEGTIEWINAKAEYDAQATQGIVSLFGGVALAMVSSIIGILLTTIGSLRIKNTKSKVEHKKHSFISWLQAELLPKISSDFSSALVQLGHDLAGFNESFSSNANLIRGTIEGIRNATESQARLLTSIEQLDIVHIAEANIKVYEQLKSCTDDIATLARDLREIQSSISGIGQFMQNGINEYERRNTYILDASGKVDIAVHDGQEKLAKSIDEIFATYNELLHTLYLRSESTTMELAKKYDAQVETIHQAIVDKLSDVKQLEVELKNLVSIKTSIINLEKSTSEQNRKLDNLANAIRELAQMKAVGAPSNIEMRIPTAYKKLGIAFVSVLSAVGLSLLVMRILEILGIL